MPSRPLQSRAQPCARGGSVVLSFATLVMTAFASSGIFAPREASAETIGDALAKAYANNADLDEQRANVRVRDEDVPKAATGMRPRASASVNGGPGTHDRSPARWLRSAQ